MSSYEEKGASKVVEKVVDQVNFDFELAQKGLPCVALTVFSLLAMLGLV